MKKLILTFTIGAVLSLLSGPVHAATIISINFQCSNTVALGSLDTVGAGAYAASNWTNVTGVSGSSLNLNDSTGTATSVSLDSFGKAGGFIGTDGGRTADGTPQEILFGGAVVSNANFGDGPLLFNFSGLGAFSSYDIVIYYDGGTSFGGDRNATFTASGSGVTYYGSGFNNFNSASSGYTQTTSTTMGTSPNANYVVFSGLTSPTETISFSTDNWMGIDGIQIVGVPEPSTYALLFAGGLVLFFLRRKRSNSIS